jgi:hypothetical protein
MLTEIRENRQRCTQLSEIIARLIESTVDQAELSSQIVTEIVEKILFLYNDPVSHRILDAHKLTIEDTGETFVFSNKKIGVLTEILSLVAGDQKLIAVKIRQLESTQQVSCYFSSTQGIISQASISLEKEEVDLRKKSRNFKKIVIAVQGDAAGHAIRALHTAKNLRDFGYTPVLIGTGQFMSVFKSEGIEHIVPYQAEDGEETKQILGAMREGKMQDYPDTKFDSLHKRIQYYVPCLTQLYSDGVAAFISDFNPVADAARRKVEAKLSIHVPSFVQTHDTHLVAHRPLRSLKFHGLPIGQFYSDVYHAKPQSPWDLRKTIVKNLFSFIYDIVDYRLGIPLFLGTGAVQSTKRDLLRLTNNMKGDEGTFSFSLFPGELPVNNEIHVGLHAELNELDTVEEWEKLIPSDVPLVLIAQGSTYNLQAWEKILKSMKKKQAYFPILVTGKKETKMQPIYDEDSSDQKLHGMVIGYAPVHRLSTRADILVSQGGWGTLSQWIKGTCDRFQSQAAQLLRLIEEGASDNQIQDYLKSVKRPPRGIAICNTYAQENIARLLEEKGGENVCRVLLADELAKLSEDEASARINNLISHLLLTPTTDNEISFWSRALEAVATQSSSHHITFHIDRKIQSIHT